MPKKGSQKVQGAGDRQPREQCGCNRLHFTCQCSVVNLTSGRVYQVFLICNSPEDSP